MDWIADQYSRDYVSISACTQNNQKLLGSCHHHAGRWIALNYARYP
jgi:hypothetical protein